MSKIYIATDSADNILEGKDGRTIFDTHDEAVAAATLSARESFSEPMFVYEMTKKTRVTARVHVTPIGDGEE